MKRKASPTKSESPPKKAKAEIPEYHLSPTVREEDGSIQWPAPKAQMEKARQMILDCAISHSKTLIVPDKDADGLSAGAILRHTLMILGLPKELIAVHLLTKGNTVHSEQERQRMAEHKPEYVFVIDHGSRSGPPVIDGTHHALIIDHHYATDADFPQGSEHVSACHSPPVATSALLTYEICNPLHPDVYERCAWLAIVGTYGDLGNQIKWEAPFPDMREILKRHSKKKLSDAVSAVNAPRRTATYDVKSAWDALCDTSEPASIPKNPRLEAARQEVAAEVERCTHTAPKFSPDGKVAVFRIRSEAQVHPVIATRWAGHLSSNKLEFVLVANEGYLPGKVNFSCRIARSARNRDPPISIIERLRYYASLTEAQNDSTDNADSGEAKRIPLLERVGDDFARGHVQASGGIVNTDEFEELMRLMQIGVKPPKDESNGGSPSKRKAKAGIDPGQKNTLTSYFGKANTTKAQ
ncbi:DHH family protein [Hortaea werneckii]|nr:DHH family protein [Hortaea werneckii]